MSTLRWSALFALAAAASLTAACKASRRPIKTGGDGSGLKTLKLVTSGLDPKDQGRGDLFYELAACVPALNGVVQEDGSLQFSSADLKKGLQGCELRVRTVGTPVNISFQAESGVLYWAKGISIGQSPEGALAAEAALQKVYTTIISADTRFELKVPITFPAAEKGATITAVLDGCQPAFTASSTFQRTSETAGELTLIASVPAPVDVACKTLWVDVDGKARQYRSALPEDIKFKAAPGQKATLPAISLTSHGQPPKPDQADLDVETEGGQCDLGTQVFDTVTGLCKARS